jgi:hypothetical protein
VRRLSLIAGIALVAIAFGAATRVADTREGLIAEVVTLLAGLVGISMVLYGLFAGARPAPRPAIPRSPAPARTPSAREFAIGAAGLGLATILVSGLGITAGLEWAAVGLVVLLPMIVGSAILCARFLRTR